MMKSRPQKHTHSSEDDSDRDRLSKLPDDVVLHILSFMPIIDAVRTVLLRRFGNLWTFIPSLNIDMIEYQKTSTTHQLGWFCYFVRNVLMLHQTRSIDRFHLCVKFYSNSQRDEIAGDIRMWSRFALGRQAKEITLSDQSNYNTTYVSIFPRLASDFLVTLRLNFCRIEGEIQVKLGSLKKLSLNHVRMTQENFQSFISGCPCLEKLVVVDLLSLTEPIFPVGNIDKSRLVLTTSLNFPNLETLYLRIGIRNLDITDIPSFRDIYIKYHDLSSRDNPVTIMYNMLLLGKSQGVEVLRLSYSASKIFLRTLRNTQLLQNRWKRIVLELDDFRESFLLGFRNLVRNSKDLEEVTIYTTKDFKAKIDLQKEELFSPSVLPQLKTLTVHCNGISWKSQLQLIEALLKSAAVLDKLVIVPMKPRVKEPEELEFIKHVSRFPSVSPITRVIQLLETRRKHGNFFSRKFYRILKDGTL